LGNSYFRLGQEGDPEKHWKQAIETYDRALELNPDDKAAADNRAFVTQQLEQLKAQNNPNPSQGEDPQGGKGQGQNGKGAEPPPSEEPPANGDDNTAADQPPPGAPPPDQPFAEEDITGALQSLEQDERNHRNRRYFRRYPNQSAGEQSLFNLTPEELMSLSPEELQEKLQGKTAPARDW
jgi:tetratricopeptide (TPR) repeat protein